MSSINFPEGMNEYAKAYMEEMFGKPKAEDEKTALYDGSLNMFRPKMRELANKAKQPVEVGIHSPGEIITLSDGTQYEVTPSGYWKKVI